MLYPSFGYISIGDTWHFEPTFGERYPHLLKRILGGIWALTSSHNIQSFILITWLCSICTANFMLSHMHRKCCISIWDTWHFEPTFGERYPHLLKKLGYFRVFPCFNQLGVNLWKLRWCVLSGTIITVEYKQVMNASKQEQKAHAWRNRWLSALQRTLCSMSLLWLSIWFSCYIILKKSIKISNCNSFGYQNVLSLSQTYFSTFVFLNQMLR